MKAKASPWAALMPPATAGAAVEDPRERCDCLTDCGDDVRVKAGTVRPCERMAALMGRPTVSDVALSATDPRLVHLTLSGPICEVDLEALRAHLRYFGPPVL